MLRAVLIWAALVAAMVVPVVISTMSPLLAWREPVYIIAGLAGVLALELLLLQPLLAIGYLPGLATHRSRGLHRAIGIGLVACVVVHVGGLWITSPPDVVDALLFRSPTPFSAWGVIAMWAVFAAAILALFRKKLRLRPNIWRKWHLSLVMIVVSGTVVHALLIEGTMGLYSKILLCGLVILAAALAAVHRTSWIAKRLQKS
ncbi:MAG: ferric reductase-like transmembrane domain-containing protein [Pseudomonadota bacterium]